MENTMENESENMKPENMKPENINPENIKPDSINPDSINPDSINPEKQKECVFRNAIPIITEQQKRKLTKIGLVTSMGLLTVTGVSKFLPFSKQIHILSGIALLGFSLWHTNSYKSTSSKKSCKTENE